jgi:hypothetical protein
VPSQPDSSRAYRVTAFAWTSRPELAACELVEVHETKASSALTAIAATELTNVADNVDRVVVDAQRVGYPPQAKAVPWAPWRVAVVWMRGHGDHADAIRDGLADLVPATAVAADDTGNLGVAAALAGHLDGEAQLDLEEQLARIFEALGLDFQKAMESSVATAVQATQPSLDTLHERLVATAERPMTEAFPRAAWQRIVEAEPEGPEQRELYAELLFSASQRAEPDLDELAARFDVSSETVEMAIETLERWGLALAGGELGPPMLLGAGAQFLARHGRVPLETLDFLPGVIDDLNAREALRRASFMLLDEFTHAIAAGDVVEHVREQVVPPAFAAAVDVRLATRMYAAASALIARLSAGHPAGCVAEEIVAVALMQEAEAILDVNEELSESDVKQATPELRGLFELFQDDDVLKLFEMSEPGDAAVAGHDPVNRQLGVADQRVEAWFRPFGWATAAGHLDEGRLYRWP